MEFASSLPRLELGASAVAVEGITGHGAARASLSLTTPQGAASGSCTRQALVSFALDLLALADQMIDDGAYATSDTIRGGEGHISSRHADGVKRFFRLRDRLPILQLAQAVLEQADDRTANTLLALLAQAQATGALPIKVDVDFRAAPYVGERASQNGGSDRRSP